MARQRISPQSGIKLFESYTDFSGGLNTETSNERLRENEYPILDNVDLSGRGSAKRRKGRILLEDLAGTPQGMFYFYRQNQQAPDIILAIEGELLVYENGYATAPFALNIEGLSEVVFQSTQPIEAVQYNKTLYVATGTKLCELSYSADPAWATSTAYKVGDRVLHLNRLYECTVAGTTNSTPPTHTSGTQTYGSVTWKYIVLTSNGGWYAKTLDAYKPTQMEFLYVGSNAIATNPTTWVDVQDELGIALGVRGVLPDVSSTAINVPVTFTAYPIYTSTAPLNQIEYKWEYKKSDNTVTTWNLAVDYAGHTVNKSYGIKFDTATTYDVRVTIRHGSTTAIYVLTNFLVTETAVDLPPSSGIQTCKNIMLYWDRLLIYGDDKNPYQVYISDLNNPGYFPTTNTISFDIGKQEPITTITRYRDYLVVFTKTTIHSLTGKSPDDYSRQLIHEGIGCVAGKTSQVTGNNILFLSAEGIYQLRPNQYVLETLNVFRADMAIKSSVFPDEDACGMVYDSQYWISFPSRGYMYRLYYEQGIWVRDISSETEFMHIMHYGANVVELKSDGKLYTQDSTVFADGDVNYDMVIQSKYLDLSMSFNYKKLKKIYILAKHFATDVALKVKVEADAAITLTPDTSHSEIINDESVWVPELTPNFNFYSGTTVGTWALGVDPLGAVELSVQRASVGGKCRRARITFTHSDNVPCEIYGFGLEFKEKKT